MQLLNKFHIEYVLLSYHWNYLNSSYEFHSCCCCNCCTSNIIGITLVDDILGFDTIRSSHNDFCCLIERERESKRYQYVILSFCFYSNRKVKWSLVDLELLFFLLWKQKIEKVNRVLLSFSFVCLKSTLFMVSLVTPHYYYCSSFFRNLIY